jgi:hypothetical protein
LAPDVQREGRLARPLRCGRPRRRLARACRRGDAWDKLLLRDPDLRLRLLNAGDRGADVEVEAAARAISSLRCLDLKARNRKASRC